MRKFGSTILLASTAFLAVYFCASVYADDISGGAGAPLAADFCDKQFALALYHPYLTGCFLLDRKVFLSGEAEYSINAHLSASAEIRYLDNPYTSSSNSKHVYAAGPGLRYYISGEGMKGVFLAGYYQLLVGTAQHGLYNPFRQRYLTGWFGVRLEQGRAYFEFAGGAVFSNTFTAFPLCPLLSVGVGIWL